MSTWTAARLLVVALVIIALAALSLTIYHAKYLMTRYWFGFYSTEEEAVRICGNGNVTGGTSLYEDRRSGELVSENFWSCRIRR